MKTMNEDLEYHLSRSSGSGNIINTTSLSTVIAALELEQLLDKQILLQNIVVSSEEAGLRCDARGLVQHPWLGGRGW